jgi:heme oxygenase (mycobilin-producing)
MTDKVFRVELRMDVAPDRQADFEQAWLEVGRAVSARPDNLSQWLLVSNETTGRYVITSDWPDEAAFRRFEQDPESGRLRSKLGSLRASVSMTTMTLLHHLEGAASR